MQKYLKDKKNNKKPPSFKCKTVYTHTTNIHVQPFFIIRNSFKLDPWLMKKILVFIALY